ncbi:MAG: DUF2845 domain-containing protein [Proteobacteria bacterium]|nr:DUF2845 domain-containing protein [Pseudomonadota bacterium]
MIYRLTILALMLCYCGAADAYGSLRCQGKIIDPGVTMAQILAMCGSPKTRIIEEIPVRARVASGFSRFIGYTTTEQWVYDRGWGRFPAVLKFQDGKLQRIDYLSYRSGAR